jgi:hypothetical protein
MKFSNFDSDPYSLVIAAPGGVSVYLKFNSHKNMTGLIDKWFRAYEGWIFPSRKPVFMIDGYEPNRDLREDLWPDPEVLKSELTETLPEN